MMKKKGFLKIGLKFQLLNKKSTCVIKQTNKLLKT